MIHLNHWMTQMPDADYSVLQEKYHMLCKLLKPMNCCTSMYLILTSKHEASSWKTSKTAARRYSSPLSIFNIIKVKRLQFSLSWGSHLKPAAAPPLSSTFRLFRKETVRARGRGRIGTVPTADILRGFERHAFLTQTTILRPPSFDTI